MTFLYGADLTQAVCDVLSGSGCDLAVAYFGKGAGRRLGLGKPKRVRIVCDLWSGACNPYEVAALKKSGADLKNARGLHAKVYIGRDAAVVTSANASINGLGEEDGDLDLGSEAGVLLRDPGELQKVRAWFESVWDSASDVRMSDL